MDRRQPYNILRSEDRKLAQSDVGESIMYK